MALVQCPECGKEISDKARYCIHCGFPMMGNVIQPENDNMCRINGQNCDLTEVVEAMNNNPKATASVMRRVTGLSENDCGALFLIIRKDGIPKEFNSGDSVQSYRRNVGMKTAPLIPTCPKCGSTSITTGPRGVNFTWGLIGASKTVNRCANCGHTWKPRK